MTNDDFFLSRFLEDTWSNGLSFEIFDRFLNRQWLSTIHFSGSHHVSYPIFLYIRSFERCGLPGPALSQRLYFTAVGSDSRLCFLSQADVASPSAMT